MNVTVLNISEKVKPNEVVPAQLANFIVTEGETLPAEILLNNPNTNLYCLDDDNKRAIFVETPAEVDLTQAPFYYHAQYQHALRLLTVPYEDLHRLADDLKVGDLIMLHSVGRCGSTVVCHAFNTVNGVQSVSEPDVYTQIHMLRHLDKSRDEEYAALLKSCTCFLGLNAPAVLIKFRGMCIHIADLLYRVFPDATNLFVYRHAESWARSMGLETIPIAERRIPAIEVPLHRRSIATLSIPFAERHGREASRVEMSALMWLSMTEKYLSLYQSGMPFLALRYEDIQAQPKDVLAAVFDYCGLYEANVDAAYAVFSKDAQEGSILSRASRQDRHLEPLEEADYAQFRSVFKEHPVIQSPDFVLPNTLNLANG